MADNRPFRWVNQDPDSSGSDAGGRTRVSQITTLLDLKQINDNAPLYYDRANINSGDQSYSKNDGGTIMSVLSDGDAAICQSKMFAPYYSGKSQFIEITFSGFHNEPGVIKRAGYFSSSIVSPYDSAKDGIWFESTGTEHRFVIQKNGTSIYSKVDDSGIDFSKFNVFVIQFLYLGGTAVKFGFIVNGSINFKQTYVHAGLVESVFIESPNQPIRYEIRSTGGAGDMTQICAMASSEGSVDEIGISRALSVQDFQATTAAELYATLGYRLKLDYRNIRIDKLDLNFLVETNDDLQWYLCLNPTVVGTFAYTDVSNSSIQSAQGDTTNVVTDLGTILDTGFSIGNTQIEKQFKNSIRPGTLIDGTQDEIVIVIQPRTGGLDIWVSLTINEFI